LQSSVISFQSVSRHSSPATRHFAMALRCSAIAAAIILLAAIATCSLSPSPHMRELPFIPTWLGTWADANPNLRNFPVFAAFAALLFSVFSAFKLQTADCRPNTATPTSDIASHSGLKLKFQPLPFRTALRAAVCASALGVLLEVAQLLLPHRWADWRDVLWSVTGAFAGAGAAMLLSSLSTLFRLKTAH